MSREEVLVTGAGGFVCFEITLALARSGLIRLQTPHAQREWCWLPELADGIVNLIAEPFDRIGTVLHVGAPPILEELALARAVSERAGIPLIKFAPGPHAPVRPQMGSGFASAFDGLAWTPIEVALDRLIPERTLQ